MQAELDFRETLERLQSCRSVQDALDILQQITDAKIGVVIPATQEKVDLIVREFEERLRQGEYPSDVDLSPEIQVELKKFLESFILPQQKQYENMDGPKEDKTARQLSRQISEEKEKEMKIIASRLGKTFLDKTVSEEREEVTDVTIKEDEPVSETDLKFGSLIEPLDSSVTALETISLPTQKETSQDGTTNKEGIWTNISIFVDGQQFEHYIKSHIDCDAFNWRLIERVAEFVVLSLYVLFGENRIQEIQNEGGDVENLKHLDVCRQLYQNLPTMRICQCGSDYINNWKKVGETKRALYKPGEQGDYSATMDKSGFEIALVKMDHEEETRIDFTERLLEQWNKLNMGTELEFKGKDKNYHDIPLDSDVYKIGKQTGLTKGVITHKNEPYKFLNSVLLLNQIVVKWGNVPFSEKGDSGSMVFTIEKGEIISIGIVTGSVEEKKLSIVTPVSEILEYINDKNKGKYYRLKHFILKTDGKTVKKIITDKIIKTMPPRS